MNNPPRSSTALTQVFERISRGVPQRPLRPAPPPQLLGFAEPVTSVPQVEHFPWTQPAAASEAAALAAREAAPPPQRPEPSPIGARVRDLPPAAPSPVMPRRQNLVGRLGRRPEPATGGSQEVDAPGRLPAAERERRAPLPRNRRLYRRARLPAEIEVDGVPCTLIDISIGGFAATGVPQLEPNALVPVTLRLTIDGIEVGTLLRARIIYVTQGRSSGRFVELSASQTAFLRYIVTWRGESVGAAGTTALLDAIAAGERGDAGPPTDPDGKSRWWAGLVGRKVNPAR